MWKRAKLNGNMEHRWRTPVKNQNKDEVNKNNKARIRRTTHFICIYIGYRRSKHRKLFISIVSGTKMSFDKHRHDFRLLFLMYLCCLLFFAFVPFDSYIRKRFGCVYTSIQLNFDWVLASLKHLFDVQMNVLLACVESIDDWMYWLLAFLSDCLINSPNKQSRAESENISQSMQNISINNFQLHLIDNK